MSSIQNEKHARQVVLTEVPKEKAKETLLGAGDVEVDFAKGVPEFEKATLDSFRAEYSVIGGNLIVHFFPPKRAEEHIRNSQTQASKLWLEYWLKRFPSKLDSVARGYFDAEYPRLQAKYTEEVASWWFRAQGYDNLIDSKKFVQGFLERLDAALRERS